MTLCLGAVQLDSFRGDVHVHAVGVEIGDVGAGHFLGGEAIAEHVEAKPAIALRRVAAEQTKGPDRVQRLRRNLSTLLDRRVVRP